MRKRHRLTIMVMLLAALLMVSTTANAGSPVGSERFLIYNDPGSTDEQEPAVAYNTQQSEYLVVWEGNGIWGQRIAASGGLMGSAFQISTGGYSPDVTYNNTANQYLVVWQTDEDVVAQRLSDSGASVGSFIYVGVGDSSSGYYYDQPAVVYASTSDRYLFVYRYHQTSDGGSIIWAESYQTNGTWDTDFTITTYSTTEKPERPDVAYNRSRNEFLIVWQKTVGSDVDVYARLAKMTGGAGTQGGEFYVAATGYDEIGPAVAAIPTVVNQGQYLVAWESDDGVDTDVGTMTVSWDGTAAATYYFVAQTGWGENSPAVAGCESNQEFLVTWTWVPVITPPAMLEVQAKTLDINGVPIETLPVTVGGGQVFDSAVAAGSAGDFLVAFDDNETFATYSRGIYGRMWGTRIYLPLVLK